MVSVEECAPLILDCGFTENSVIEGGALLRLLDSAPEISGCTFADNSGIAGGVVAAGGQSVLSLANTIIAFNAGLEPVLCGGAAAGPNCCDVYGNEAGDWIGCIAGQAGISGNFSADPLFCGDASPGEPYTLREDSPCAEGNNPECQMQVGAWPVGCEGGTAVGDGGWIASLYLSRPAPNPARSGARMAFALPSGASSGEFCLKVYDLSGAWCGRSPRASLRAAASASCSGTAGTPRDARPPAASTSCAWRPPARAEPRSSF